MNPIRYFRRLSADQRLFALVASVMLVALVLYATGIAGPGVLFLAVTAALPTTNPTLADVVRQQAPDGSLLPIVEALTKMRPFLEDATWIECNNGTFHKVNTRNVLPTPSYRLLNQGVAATKSATQQVDETTSILSDKAQVDASMVRAFGPEYRTREIAAHMQGLLNQVEGDVFYSSTKTTPKQFHGLAPRFDASAGTPAGNQILKVDATASGSDQASMWLIGWGPHAVHMIYPSGTSGGIMHKDLGELLIDDGTGTGNTFPGFVDWFDWFPGMAVEDYRYAARGANIDTGNLTNSGTSIIDSSIDMLYQVQYQDSSVRWAWYVPLLVARFLHHQAQNKASTTLTIDTVEGKPKVSLHGIPVRVSNGLLITESVVT